MIRSQNYEINLTYNNNYWIITNKGHWIDWFNFTNWTLVTVSSKVIFILLDNVTKVPSVKLVVLDTIFESLENPMMLNIIGKVLAPLVEFRNIDDIATCVTQQH